MFALLTQRGKAIQAICFSKFCALPISSPRRFFAADCKTSRVVFLGTPECAVPVLRALHDASKLPGAGFEVSAVVSRARKLSAPVPDLTCGANNLSSGASAASRSSAACMSAVERAARELGFTSSQILCPPNAKDESFLSALRDLSPDLCVTAAYGCMLPQRFLDIPRLGTLNVHPSLLPKYRGAAPVQRALQDGLEETGVSVAFTVLRCDAGPVLARASVPVSPDEQAPELTTRLFALGSELLLQQMPLVLSGGAWAAAVPQDEAQATHAAKITRQESYLDFSLPACAVHNKVRAFAGWPGTRAALVLQVTGAAATAAAGGDGSKGSGSAAAGAAAAAPGAHPVELRVLRTRVAWQGQQQGQEQHGGAAGGTGDSASGGVARLPAGQISLVGGRMLVPCGGGSALEVLEVKSWTTGNRSKQSLTGREFMAGLSKRRLLLPTQQQQQQQQQAQQQGQAKALNSCP